MKGLREGTGKIDWWKGVGGEEAGARCSVSGIQQSYEEGEQVW